jgi:hypothetical protein
VSTAIAALARLLPRRPNLLLAGDPSLLWRIAPPFGRALVITLLDHDRDALGAALSDIAEAAAARGIVATWPGRALLLHVPGGAWRIEAAMVPDLSGAVLRRLAGDALIVQGAVPLPPPPMKLLLLDLPVAPPQMLPVMAEPWLREAWRRDHGMLARELDILRDQGWRLTRWPRSPRTPRGDVQRALRALDRVLDLPPPRAVARWERWRALRERQATRGRLIVQRRLLDVLAMAVTMGRDDRR